MQHYHLIGIGGIAMGGMAIALKNMGFSVSGSDQGVYPPMSDLLRAAGIVWHEGFFDKTVQSLHESCPDLQLVVGNAIPRGNPELEAALRLGLRLSSLPELVHERFLPGSHSVVIAGTHGKTTTSNLCAWLLERLGRQPGWLIGGRPFGLEQGLRAPGSVKGHEPVFVSEGDEYDTSFWDKRSKFFHYWPRTLVVNHVEFDHADIFASIDVIRAAFARLAMLVPGNGLILANGDAPHALLSLWQAWTPLVLFGESEPCAYRLLDEAAAESGSRFTVSLPVEGHLQAELPALLSPALRLKELDTDGPDDDHRRLEHARHSAWQPAERVTVKVDSLLSGTYSGRNLLVAIAVMDRLGLPRDKVLKLIGDFAGPGRRMDRYMSDAGGLLYDDFAHHPTAVRETLAALRLRHADRRIIALVEPRSNTSVRNVMQQEWIDALKGADGVVFGALHRPWKYDHSDLFSFDAANRELEAAGTAFHQVDTAAGIVDWLVDGSASGSPAWLALSCLPPAGLLHVIFSNGAFDGLLGMMRERFELVSRK